MIEEKRHWCRERTLHQPSPRMICKLPYRFPGSLGLNDVAKEEGRALTMPLPLCETINPLRLFASPDLMLVTHFKLRLPKKLLGLAQQIMSLTLKVNCLGL